jgi:acid phosphatase family membrane protein YuiD
MKTLLYPAIPVVAWFINGVLKFIINSAREKRIAFDLIGYGGMPSNHSAIVGSIAALIGLGEGINSAIFGIAIAFAFIVVLDAGSLRRSVGLHAEAINRLTSGNPMLRERMGHSKLEISVGLLVGIIVALVSFEIGGF